MTAPQGYYPPVLHADIEFLVQAYLGPKLQPTPVRTKLPSNQTLTELPNGILRIESGDAVPVTSTWGAAWDIPFLMHAYSPDEVEASLIDRTAAAYVTSAIGLTVVGWYIVDVVHFLGGRRLSDPEVPTNIVRYRSACTWRVAGQPLH